VDTPEVSGGEEPCGLEASAFTTEQLEGQDVTLEFNEDPADPYGRALAYVWVFDLGGELFNETLVREGLARVLTVAPNDKYEERFPAAEREARDEGLGVWATDPCSTPERTTVRSPQSAQRQYPPARAHHAEVRRVGARPFAPAARWRLFLRVPGRARRRLPPVRDGGSRMLHPNFTYAISPHRPSANFWEPSQGEVHSTHFR
jgi:hypothetical protein